MSRKSVKEFLKTNNMLFESFDRNDIEKAFLRDMEECKSLLMSNSYQISPKTSVIDRDILVIDMGGTNYRIAVYNKGEITGLTKKPMYAVDKELDADEFLDLIAADIEQYQIKDVGFCFSYEINSLPDHDAEIVHLAKEIKLKNIKGRILGQELNKRLSLKRNFSILNDTVAAQLGADSDVGIIIGTGFNIAYTDTILGYIVDAECGQYVLLPKGKFDEMMNDKFPDTLPCVEKMVSGAYLAHLIKYTADEYFGSDIPEFDLIDVTKLFSNEGLLYEYFTVKEKYDDFIQIVYELEERAAKYIALMLKCMLSRNNQSHVKIALEGSTIYSLPGYYEALEYAFKVTLNRSFEIVNARDRIFEGCAKAI